MYYIPKPIYRQAFFVLFLRNRDERFGTLGYDNFVGLDCLWVVGKRIFLDEFHSLCEIQPQKFTFFANLFDSGFELHFESFNQLSI